MKHLSEVLQKENHSSLSKIALQIPNENPVSYVNLFEKINQFTNFLQTLNIKTGDKVGICLPKSYESVYALFAVLNCKACYVPIDVDAPIKRNIFITKDCNATGVFLPENKVKDFITQLSLPTEVLDLPGFNIKYVKIKTDGQLNNLYNDLAIILYTSGSTGTPKGVMITHENVLSFIIWSSQTFDLSQNDVFSSIAMFHFDLSTFDLFVGLLHSASIILLDAKATKNPLLISSFIEEFKITVCYATPTLLKLILNYGKMERYNHSSLKTVLFAGEVFPIEDLKKLQSSWSQVDFYNLYGPTETNVVTWHKVSYPIPETFSKPMPIGRSCSHVDCKIWDHKFIPSITGNKGELVVTGKSVTPGYLNLPDKTQSSFINDSSGTSWYRTGDLVSLNDNLEFEFIGRVDRMIKKHGYRVELDEIEAVLHKSPQLANVGVICKIKKGLPYIHAFLVGTQYNTESIMLEIRQYFLQHLPMYMLPDEFTFLDELPKTSTHKIDYQKLARL